MSIYTAPRFGLPNQTPWDWQVREAKSLAQVKRDQRRAKERLYDAARRMKKKALRVNPEAEIDSGWVPKSLTAPR